MRSPWIMLLVACGGHHNSGNGGDGGNGNGPDACVDLQCQVTNCAAMSKPPTTIKGTVFAPNGTLPLYDVSVYVPSMQGVLPAFAPGVQCGQCSDNLPGDPIVTTTTSDGSTTPAGSFELDNIPDGDNIPVVITIGKWRRQLKLAHVDACSSTSLAAVDTSLPKSIDDMTPNTTAVDMPLIAISTGSADSLECLVRRLGIADKEITTDTESGHIHLFSDLQAGRGKGVSAFQNGGGWTGGTGSFSDSQALWGTSTAGDKGKLSNYDIVILSCEGEQAANTKSQNAMNNMKAFADVGGRVFMSHWHNVWIEGSTQDTTNGTQKPMVWPAIATYSDNSRPDPGNGTIDTIDETDNPKGPSFASWMLDPAVTGSTTRDKIAIQDGTAKNTCTAIDKTKAEDWVNLLATDNPSGKSGPQMFQFTTPNEDDPSQRCGKVVFSDMHVSGNAGSGSYPTSCGDPATPAALTPQEKALAFMFFDIASCVNVVQ
ncbi:MAG TPA: hypothetical protein VMJ10_23190 [Kofleriaceae bacterium]|nr:hypothetical protein [Kofleriaceae bacterium]